MTSRPRALRTTAAPAALVLGAAGLLAAACAPTTTATTAVVSSAASSAAATTATPASSSAAAAPSMTAVGPETPTGSASTATAAGCSPATLRTRTAGTLTLATSQPAYEPWMVGNDPTNGKGYESAVAYAAAARLGYPKARVAWVRADFDAAIAPGPKTFDADVNQFSITAARAKVVDFSAPYYDVTQAVVYLDKDAKAAAAARTGTVAGLAGLKLGAQVGTTSYDAITNQVKPSGRPAAYPSNDNAVQGLKAGQIDGLVVDLPTALYLTSAELTGASILGQLPAAGGRPEQFGMLLAKGSPVTSCLSNAVAALAADGTLARLEKTWLTSSAGAPELK